jgi:DNA-binding MarR family transcriptional regulator
MTVDSGDDLDVAVLAEKLHWNLFRITSAMRRREYFPDDEQELTLTQYSVLYALREDGRCRITDLAAHEGVRAPTMTRTITRLESRGMVTRSRDFSDKRIIWIEATPRGLRALQTAIAETVGGIGAILSITDLQTLQAALPPLERIASVVADRVATGLGGEHT